MERQVQAAYTSSLAYLCEKAQSFMVSTADIQVLTMNGVDEVNTCVHVCL